MATCFRAFTEQMQLEVCHLCESVRKWVGERERGEIYLTIRLDGLTVLLCLSGSDAKTASSCEEIHLWRIFSEHGAIFLPLSVLFFNVII